MMEEKNNMACGRLVEKYKNNWKIELEITRIENIGNKTKKREVGTNTEKCCYQGCTHFFMRGRGDKTIKHPIMTGK